MVNPRYLEQEPIVDQSSKNNSGQKNGNPPKIPPLQQLIILFALDGGNSEQGVYGLDLQARINSCAGANNSISLSSIYALLKRLRARGMVASYEGKSTTGGAKRIYYYLTPTGEQVLDSIDRLQKSLQTWKCD